MRSHQRSVVCSIDRATAKAPTLPIPSPRQMSTLGGRQGALLKGRLFRHVLVLLTSAILVAHLVSSKSDDVRSNTEGRV